MNSEEVYTNRLIKEKSPYLLQHAHNPVDWFPWGEEAFEKARKEDKPIFLSIGYSTCHWCHVMEDESFSSRDIADIMNKYFVSIKIDREERPDIDNLYMSAVVSLTGSGGWPLTVFLTPDLKPFYGGTYFPPDDRFGMPGLKTLLLSIADVWKNRRKDALDSGESLMRALQYQPVSGDNKSVLSEETLKTAYTQLLQTFDRRFGGFGKAPKFPASHSLSFLLRYWKRSGEKEALKMVEKTLLEMARGGMYDHIGGGFHRYSTDGEWRVPHFEKMLYDQALLSRTCLEAYQATGKEEFSKTAIDIFEYVLRDMAHPEGGFYSAEDADSPAAQQSDGSGNLPARKSEGAFYIWGKDEIIKILGREEGDVFCYYFGVEPEGNALQDPQGEFRGKNILYVAHDMEETAGHFKKIPKDVENILKDAKEKIYHSRLKRIRPHLDDKVLVDWNGLMLSSLAFGSRVLNEPRYRDAAEKSARFILKHLKNKDGRLLHRYRDGESIIPGMLDDYAFFVHGLLDLYEATFNPDFLKKAKQLTDEMLKYFWDGSGGGFFITGSDAQKILIRRKEIYDGAIPSGNSMAAIDLLRLGRLTMNKDFEAKTEALLKRFSGDISQAPAVYTQMLAALDFALGPSKEIVLTAEKGSIDTPRMINSIYRRFIPNKVVAFRPASGKEAEMVIGLIPFLKEQLPLNGKATVYVCENYACNLPVTSVEKMEEILDVK